jgi:hypothetical protein
MRKTFAIILLAAPAFTAMPDFAHAHCTWTPVTESNAGGPLAPRGATYAASGFGRLPMDSVIECFGGCEASGL